MQRLRKSALIGATALMVAATGSDDIAWPDGFRGWTAVHSGVITSASPLFARFGGIHTTYANALAMQGYRGGAFPDGSVIVFDVRETGPGPAYYEPVRRKQVDVMIKADGRWRFTEFAGDSRTDRTVTATRGDTQCAGCHTKAPRDSVYSRIES